VYKFVFYISLSFFTTKKTINKGCESQEGFYKGKQTNDASCTAFQSGSLKLRESKEVKMATTLQVKRGRVCLNFVLND
jgi:hypothetical protein